MVRRVLAAGAGYLGFLWYTSCVVNFLILLFLVFILPLLVAAWIVWVFVSLILEFTLMVLEWRGVLRRP